MICDPGDVVVVPFPFAERPGAKRRPALVLSRRGFNESGHTILSMITTKADPPWPGDVGIHHLDPAGLPRPCLLRLKVFTLDNRLIMRRAGRLAQEDREAVRTELEEHVALDVGA